MIVTMCDRHEPLPARSARGRPSCKAACSRADLAGVVAWPAATPARLRRCHAGAAEQGRWPARAVRGAGWHAARQQQCCRCWCAANALNAWRPPASRGRSCSCLDGLPFACAAAAALWARASRNASCQGGSGASSGCAHASVPMHNHGGGVHVCCTVETGRAAQGSAHVHGRLPFLCACMRVVLGAATGV